jgi:hypothetical protein
MKVRVVPQFAQGNGRSERAMTLVEMLVASSLLLVIVLGLLAMFNQTQRAFRTNMRQSDVFEGVRAALDLIARDFEQMAKAEAGADANLYATLPTAFEIVNVAGTGPLRYNYLQDIFFLTHDTNWAGIGYEILDPNNPLLAADLVGALYRFSTNSPLLGSNDLVRTFLISTGNPVPFIRAASLSPIIDGVVHFQAQFYDANGNPLSRNPWSQRMQMTTNNVPGIVVSNALTEVYFFGDALPAYVELEIGILEPQILAQYRSIPTGGNAAKSYLQRQAGKIHIFRQHIPIRAARR